MPTGTLANHLAVRELAGGKHRVIVQEESHLYADEADCAQLLSGLNLVPLGAGRATLTLDEVRETVERSARPPYPVPVGAISIESPVRRTTGQVFQFDEMQKICAFAREKKIGLHLDGARLYLASAYSGISPARYASLFDTVYVSLYKYFNAPFGAILAGPKDLLLRVRELRHPFGSLVYHAWEPAAVALHYLNGFSGRYQSAMERGEKLFQLLAESEQFRVERVASGTNIATLHLKTGTVEDLRSRLAKPGINLRTSSEPTKTNLMINETILRQPVEQIAAEFLRAS